MAAVGGTRRWASVGSVVGAWLVMAAGACEVQEVEPTSGGGGSFFAPGGAPNASGGDSDGGTAAVDAGAGGEGGTLVSGPGGEGGADSGQAGGGVAPAVEGCVKRPLAGTYRMQAHNEVTTCNKSTLTCADTPRLVEDATVTFAIYNEREAPDTLLGDFYGPGITLGEGFLPTEWWFGYFTIYYPEPGDDIDIWSTDFPPGRVAFWEPERAGSWVRLMTDVGYGFVHIDIELATGRVLDFARKIDADFSTIWEEYRLRGTGELACDLAACNDLVNAAPAASISAETVIGPLGGGELVSGTYYLTDIKYDLEDGCDYAVPSEVRETLEITASSATSGTLQLVTERPPAAALTGTYDYQTDSYLTIRHRCGPESFMTLGAAGFSASATELRFRQPVPVCMGLATYVYEKQ